MNTGLQPPEFSIAYENVEDGLEAGHRRNYHADVVVVGSGAGGAPAARRLREAGHDVLIIEEGGLHLTPTFNTDFVGSTQRLYRDAGTSVIMGSPPIMFAEGRCVGGSTVINGGMSWHTPEHVLDVWSRDLKLDGTDPVSMAPYFAEADRILHVEHQHPDTLGRHDDVFVRGARRLGWEVTDNPRNMHRCMGLNNCALGCPTGAKQSMLVTEIHRALAAGAGLLTHARVDRVLFERRRAVGVTGSFVDEYGRRCGRFTVRARLVVLAAGARHTPGILLRSRLRSPMLGRGLHTHPNAKVVGLFEERLDPWVGAHQAHQIHQFLDEGILMAYAAVPPGILATGIPGFGSEHGRLMARYNHMLTAGCLIEDNGQGRVRLGLDRQPWMSFELSTRDVETIHSGVRKVAELMFAAGASSVLLPFGDLAELDSPDQLGRIDQRRRIKENIELMTVHIMSSARMASHDKAGPCDEAGRIRGRPGLVVADASVIPTSVGVNPMETIVALALRNTDRWLDDLAGSRRAAA
ncbi:MAG: GMC family oxidoreductase [Deltaproteobacteria bacterium]